MKDMLNALAIMRSNYSEFWICAARKRFNSYELFIPVALYIRVICTKCELALRLAKPRTFVANRKIVNELFISALNLAWLRIPHELCIIYGIDSRDGGEGGEVSFVLA